LFRMCLLNEGGAHLVDDEPPDDPLVMAEVLAEVDAKDINTRFSSIRRVDIILSSGKFICSMPLPVEVRSW